MVLLCVLRCVVPPGCIVLLVALHVFFVFVFCSCFCLYVLLPSLPRRPHAPIHTLVLVAHNATPPDERAASDAAARVACPVALEPHLPRPGAAPATCTAAVAPAVRDTGTGTLIMAGGAITVVVTGTTSATARHMEGVGVQPLVVVVARVMWRGWMSEAPALPLGPLT